jgi:hypothetical protein
MRVNIKDFVPEIHDNYIIMIITHAEIFENKQQVF